MIENFENFVWNIESQFSFVILNPVIILNSQFSPLILIILHKKSQTWKRKGLYTRQCGRLDCSTLHIIPKSYESIIPFSLIFTLIFSFNFVGLNSVMFHKFTDFAIFLWSNFGLSQFGIVNRTIKHVVLPGIWKFSIFYTNLPPYCTFM